MNDLFRDMITRAKRYTIGDVVRFNTCIRSTVSCRKCDLINQCVCKTTKKRMWQGKIVDVRILTEGTQHPYPVGSFVYTIEVHDGVSQVHVPQSWINHNIEEAEEEEKLINKFIW